MCFLNSQLFRKDLIKFNKWILMTRCTHPESLLKQMKNYNRQASVKRLNLKKMKINRKANVIWMYQNEN